MFESLSDRIGSALKDVRGRGRITEENVRDTLRQVRMALLEADVALPVVKDFVARVKERAEGAEVQRGLDPGQAFVKIVKETLIWALGEPSEGLALKARPPAVVLLAGLQGVGKTTTAGKLARWLAERDGRSVALVSTDVRRPAAIEQLRQLADQVGAGFIPSSETETPEAITERALAEARRMQVDVLIVDTAGRLHVDAELMGEVERVHAVATPAETLFVVDALAGQDAVNAARAFADALPLTGVILTKTDGDGRGGAALSVRHVTGAPIRFLGTGEKADGLELFHPDRLAGRILGMGDVLSLVEDVERSVDRDKAEKLARKVKAGKGFDLQDFREQIGQMLEMGGMGALMDKLPGMPAGGAAPGMDDGQLRRQKAIIDSMTPRERRRPALIDGSRKRRIAAGSGTLPQDVNRLLKQFGHMQKMMKKMKGKGLQGMLRGLGGQPPRGFRR